MIHVSSQRPDVLNYVRTAFAPECEVSIVPDWDEFVSNLPNADCSVLVISLPPQTQELLLIADMLAIKDDKRSLSSMSSMSSMSSIPLLIVDDHGLLEECLAGRSLRTLSQSVLDRNLSLAVLADAVPQESARAALEFAANRVRADANLPYLLRRALLHLLRPESDVHTVEQIAAIAECNAATLRKHWRRHVSHGSTLKSFVNAVLLIRARSRKTLGLSWNDVARESDRQTHHLRAFAKSCGLPWPRRNEQPRWLQITRWFRQRAGVLFAGTAQ